MGAAGKAAGEGPHTPTPGPPSAPRRRPTCMRRAGRPGHNLLRARGLGFHVSQTENPRTGPQPGWHERCRPHAPPPYAAPHTQPTPGPVQAARNHLQAKLAEERAESASLRKTTDVAKRQIRVLEGRVRACGARVWCVRRVRACGACGARALCVRSYCGRWRESILFDCLFFEYFPYTFNVYVIQPAGTACSRAGRMLCAVK
jgi:hypothetical protein